MFTCPADNRVLSRCLVGTRMFTCPAVSVQTLCVLSRCLLELECLLARLSVSLVDVLFELECLLARQPCVLSRCLVGTRMFTCPADNRVSLVDVWLELECLLARLTTVFP